MKDIQNFNKSIDFIAEETFHSLPEIIKNGFNLIYDQNDEETCNELKIFVQDLLMDMINKMDKNTASIISFKKLQAENNRRTQQQKKRWMNLVKKELQKPSAMGKNKYIMGEVDLYNLYNKKFKTSSDMFAFKSDKELIEIKLNQLTKWLNNKSSMLSEFLYFNNLTNFQKQAGLKYDINGLLLTKIINDYGGNINSAIVEHPTFFTDAPIFVNAPKTYTADIIQKRKNPQSQEYEYFFESIKGNYSIINVVLSDKKELQNLDILKNEKPYIFHNLDVDDLILLDASLAMRTSDFLKNKTIQIYLKDMLNYLNLPTTGANYTKLKQQYEKLYNRELEIYYKKGSREITHRIKFFQYIKTDVDNDYRDRSYIEIQITDMLSNILIEQQTYRLYKKYLTTFKSPTSKILLFLLQKDRIDCYNHGLKYIKKYDTEILIDKLFLDDYNKESKISTVLDAFEEFKSQSIILQDYLYKKETNSFLIKFMPLTEMDIKYLINKDENIINQTHSLVSEI